MQVLYVDPDVDEREEVRRAFAAEGASLTGVTTAEAATAELAADPVDVVVCEHALPETDAPALLERVRASAPDLPAVVYTDAGSESLAGEVVAAGADGYVPKAEGPGTLVERVAAVAEGRRRPVDASEGVDSWQVDARADRLSLLVEQAPLGIVEWDLQFQVVGWNPAAERLFGYDAGEAAGLAAWELVPERDRAHVEAVWERLLDADGGTHSVNANVRADGTEITCEWHNTPVVDDGEVVGVLSFVRDVTGEMRRAEQLEALQETSRALIRADSREAVAAEVVDAAEAVLDQSVASVWLYDPDADAFEPAAFTEAAGDVVEPFVEDPPEFTAADPVRHVFEAGEGTILDREGLASSAYGRASAGESPVADVFVEPLGDHGVLLMGDPDREALDETDVRMATVLATTAAAAMDSAARADELARYETIVEAVGDGVYALDDEGRFTHVNEELVSITGYERAELLGAHVSLVIDEAAVERGERTIRDLLAGDVEVATFEMDVRTRDGQRVPCEVHTSLLPGEGFTGTVGTVRTVAERKRMERELRERKRKIEGLHEVATRLDECATEANICEVAVEAAATILAFDVCVLALADGDELVARATSFEEPPAFYERRLPADEGIWGRTYQDGETVVVEDLQAGDGGPTGDEPFRAVLSVPVGERGVLQAISREAGAFDDDDAELLELLAAHAANALDRVAFQTELRSERDRLAALFDNVPDPVVSCRFDGPEPIVEAVNPAFEWVFGYEAADIVGENLDDYLVPPAADEEAETFNSLATDGEVVEAEVRRRTADGLRDFELTVVPVELGGDSPTTFGVYADVTERKRRRRRVQVLNRVLRHDLRNGMNIVKGAAELLVDRMTDSELADHAEAIVDRSEELLALAERTRAVERALDGEQALGDPIDLAAVASETVRTLATEYPDADLEFSGPSEALVDGNDLLERAIYDVVENAVVHNDRPAPQVSVTVTPGERGDVHVLTVTDDGPGIPEEERRLLTSDRDITQLRHASGLGLWLVNWAVTHAGGDLTIEDDDPRGSVVTVRLPRAHRDAATRAGEGRPVGDE